MKVIDYMRKNENDIVVLHQRLCPDSYEPEYKTIWSGRLFQIPEQYWRMTVISYSWNQFRKFWLIGVVE